MSAEEPLDILLKSSNENNAMSKWNKWRLKNANEISFNGYDLSGKNFANANFSRVSLIKSNLSSCDLSGAVFRASELFAANFTYAILNGANFNGAKLINANFTCAKLFRTDFSNTLLSEARFNYADITRAELINVDLTGADFSNSVLFGVNLNNCILKGTIFTNSIISQSNFRNLELTSPLGLDKTKHIGYSSVDLSTLRISQGSISQVFLRKCGFSNADLINAKLFDTSLSNTEIVDKTYEIASFYMDKPIELRPVFISFSFFDVDFAEKLKDRLEKDHHRTWLASKDMIAGPIVNQVHERINVDSIVIVILSNNSVNSRWVKHEIRMAAKRQGQLVSKLGKYTLFPIAIDDSFKTNDLLNLLGPDGKDIMDMYIVDFSKWNDDVFFEKQYDKLVNGLYRFT